MYAKNISSISIVTKNYIYHTDFVASRLKQDVTDANDHSFGLFSEKFKNVLQKLRKCTSDCKGTEEKVSNIHLPMKKISIWITNIKYNKFAKQGY